MLEREEKEITDLRISVGQRHPTGHKKFAHRGQEQSQQSEGRKCVELVCAERKRGRGRREDREECVYKLYDPETAELTTELQEEGTPGRAQRRAPSGLTTICPSMPRSE